MLWPCGGRITALPKPFAAEFRTDVGRVRFGGCSLVEPAGTRVETFVHMFE